MNKQQIQKRVSPEVIARVLREWTEGRITTKTAQEALEISRPQLYRLKTSWLARGKAKSIKLGVSGGDHAQSHRCRSATVAG